MESTRFSLIFDPSDLVCMANYGKFKWTFIQSIGLSQKFQRSCGVDSDDAASRPAPYFYGHKCCFIMRFCHGCHTRQTGWQGASDCHLKRQWA